MVVRTPPFQFTVDVLRKLVPFTSSVKAEPPAAAEFGTRVAIVGVGAWTVKNTLLEVPPPGVGFVTDTGMEPTA